MRRTLITLVFVVIGGAALAAPVAAQIDREDIVVVAGHGTVGPTATVDVAAVQLNGQARGTLRIDNGPGFFFVSEVRCVRVVENAVLVGGVIVDAFNPSLIGHTSMIAVDDGGPGGADNVGIAFSPSGLDSCPAFPLPVSPVTSGNFVVHTG